MAARINWAQAVAEVGLLALGALIAVGVDSCVDNRRELTEEREVLAGLRAHFEDVRSRLDLWVGYNGVGADLAARALSEGGSRLQDAAVDSLMSSLPWTNVIDRGGGPLDALLTSGRLELIRSRRLRAQLAEWPDRMEDLHTNDLAVRTFVMETILPYAASQGVPSGRCISGVGTSEQLIGEPVTLYCVPESELPESYRELLGSSQFRALLASLTQFRRVLAENYAAASEFAEELIRLIDENLEV